jgi:hypothetical protein
LIVGLGDSFGMMGDFEKTNFFQVLQNELTAKKIPATVQNLSVTQYETFEELEMLRNFGLGFHPKVVVQAFYVGNDTHGNPPGALKVTPNLINVRTPQFSLFSPSSWILPTVARHLFIYLREQARMGHQQAGRAPSSSMSKESYLGVLRMSLGHFLKTYPSSTAWKETRDTLIQTAQAARAQGVAYVLAILPDQLQIEDAYQEELFRSPDVKREDYDFELPQKLLNQLGRELGITVIDLYPLFRARGRQGGLYLFQETHWNDAGNLLAGQTIAARLIESKLLDRPK